MNNLNLKIMSENQLPLDQAGEKKRDTRPVKKENTQVAKKDPVKAIVFTAQKQFEASNEYKMNFNREAGFAIQILQANSYIQKCTPESIRNSIVNTALTGLTLNPALKYAYLVPRKTKDDLLCVLDISYIGMIKLLTDAGAVKNIDADIICENDKYDFRKGTDSYLKHSPSLSDRGTPVGVYAIAYFRDGGSQFVILNKEDVEKVRATSESWKNESARKYSPWETWTEEMWKKTALKRLFKLLPKTHFSDQLVAALGRDYDNEMSDIKQNDELENVFGDVETEAEIIE